MAKKTKTETETKTKTKTKVKKQKIEGEPKKNKSSYMFFCLDERQNIKTEKPDLANKEIIVELAARWRKLQETPKKLEKFQIMAQNDKERFLKEKEEFKTSGKVSEDSDETKPAPSKTKKVSKDKEVVEKKTKVNGYINFCKKMREQVKQDNPELLPKDVTRELGVLWKALSDEEKESYKY